MTNQKTRFISLVSGKGGTGKTLLTATLGLALAREGYRVLLVDLDIYVRGLSIMLSRYTRRFVHSKALTISDFLILGKDYESKNWKPIQHDFSLLAISRFLECYVLPAIRDIGGPLDYDELLFTSPEYNEGFIRNLFLAVNGQYDLVLLDCRSGIDSHILTIVSNSDFVISVAEDDDVCLQANTNLINHLRYKQNIKNVFTLINKGRRITSYDDLKTKSLRRTEFNYMGVVPFDIEVMQDFSKERFWATVYRTLYFRGLIDAWNYFAERNGLGMISENKYRFPPLIFMSKKAGRLTLVERMLRIYGVIFTTFGITFFLFNYFMRFRMREIDIFDLMVYVSITIGVVSLLLSAFNFRKWILGKTDAPKEE